MSSTDKTWPKGSSISEPCCLQRIKHNLHMLEGGLQKYMRILTINDIRRDCPDMIDLVHETLDVLSTFEEEQK